ncbi:hypothetical protein DL346_12570 [Paenibacillus montanisoli]|uniref:Uncharacterized protein n=2 Tax=Paenibacillus montanisoli TaxID=2081970 RepID=A0A328U5M6_9BACL|nr:hypothetical protein DL346_12570 [Paenibacillus montanisoli]
MESWQTIMLIGGIVVVCAAILPRRAASVKQDDSTQTVRNMETALEQFMENMEADNRELADLVSKSAREAQLQTKKRDERIEQLENRCAELEQLLAAQANLYDAASVRQQPVVQPLSNIEPISEADPAVPEESSLSIRHRYAELFELYQSGKSIDAIAKKLGRNKGEVQLILQLSKQEEAARHE